MSMVFIPGKRLPSLSEIKMSHVFATFWLSTIWVADGWTKSLEPQLGLERVARLGSRLMRLAQTSHIFDQD